MKIDFMEAISPLEKRLQDKLPIKSDDEKDYFRARFYCIVDNLKDEYFVSAAHVDSVFLLNEMFSSIRSNVGNWDMSKLDDFKIALANSFIAAAEKLGCKIKVTTNFLKKRFLSDTDKRFNKRSAKGMALASFALKYLLNEGIDQYNAMKIIEAGVSYAETYPLYNLSSQEFQLKIMEGIVKECNRYIYKRL